MVELKTESEIAAMAAAGAVVAEALRAVVDHAAPGARPPTSTASQRRARQAHAATSPFLNYHPRWAPTPFPAVLCVSVNDAVVHGIPNGAVLIDGDLVSVDFGATLRRWCGDAARSFIVGTPRRRRTPRSSQRPTRRWPPASPRCGPATPSATSGTPSRRWPAMAGYGMLADHGGHGIGRTMHEAPHVPNEGRRGKGMKLRPGLVIAIEPMLIADGTDDYRHDSDGWTLRTATGARAAHSEHTVAITRDGARILTN